MTIRSHEVGAEVLLESDIAPEQRTHELGVEVLIEKDIEPVVGRLGIAGGVSDLVMVGVEPDAVEYAWINTGFDDEAETAEYAHLNTTENAEAVIGRLALGGGSDEAALVGYTLGSAVLTDSITAAGQDAHLTWDETPTGTRVDFEVFRRSPSTGARFDPVADAVVGSNYSDEVLSDSPVGYWRYEETSGSTVADETSNGNDGTTVNGVVLDVSGPTKGLGSAANFDGTDDYIDLGSPSVLNITGDLTIEAWIKTPAATSRAITTWANNHSSFPFHLVILDTGELRLNRDGTQADSTGTVDDNAWHHVVVIDDRANNEARFYIDGVLDTTVAYSPAPSSGDGFLTLSRSGGNQPWNGLMDECAIYDAVLSQTRVESHYDAAFDSARIASGVEVLEYTDVDPPTGDYDWQVFARVERN